MCTLLESVVSEGTGKNAYVSGYRVGGKTGTSEKRDKEVALGGNYYIASFLGIAPCDNPKYAVLVILDEPTGYLYQGGQIAAPVVGRIMSDLLPYMGVKAVYTEEELAKLSIAVPNLVGNTKSWAQYTLQTAGLKNIKIVGTGDKVTAQYPIPGAGIPSSATVILYMGVEPDTTQIKVPNLIGKSYEDAIRIVEASGLYMQVAGALNPNNGSDYVITKQLPGKDAYTTFGSVITVEFYTHDDVGE
jgi:stage V sporulation protein D (sporulation-specific penicillin-binding protein)